MEAAISRITAVVPARAGIFPTRTYAPSTRRCRPRTRGDLPCRTRHDLGDDLSSPHARGSSRPIQAGRRHCRVVPARAGIFPRVFRETTRRSGRPRTRGDLPAAAPTSSTAARSSPHARGSSHPFFEQHQAAIVVPARAGIFPSARRGRAPPSRRPRTRGDLPPRMVVSSPESVSSPHARGSSRPWLPPVTAGRVVPARAGIFPTGDRWTARDGRRPRTRGDLPRTSVLWACQAKSSPHARGSSRRASCSCRHR